MSCFLQILRCILCCEEDGSEERMLRHHYEVLARSSSPPRFHERISQGTSNYWSSAPIILSKPESIERPRVAPPKIFSSPSPSIQPRNSIDPAARVAPPKVISSPSQLIQPRNSVDPAARVVPPKVISSPSQSIQRSNSIDPAVKNLIGERDSRNQSLVSSARTGSDKESLAKQPGASRNLTTPSSPSLSVPERNLVDPSSGLSKLGQPKKLLGSLSGSDQPNRSPASLPGLDPPKKPPESPNMAGRQKSPLPTYEIPEKFEDLIKKDNVPAVLRKPLSPSTYKDYFAALLYFEDCHL